MIKDGCVGGVTCARRQRTRSHARPGFRNVWDRTWRSVSRVRWWCHLFILVLDDDEVEVGDGVVRICGGLLEVVIYLSFQFS